MYNGDIEQILQKVADALPGNKTVSPESASTTIAATTGSFRNKQPTGRADENR